MSSVVDSAESQSEMCERCLSMLLAEKDHM